jgi:hypothetical protein
MVDEDEFFVDSELTESTLKDLLEFNNRNS